MKNRVLGKILVALFSGSLFWGVAACSEKNTAGGTIDDNAVAEFSADEKAIMESKVDSIKVFAETVLADIGDYEMDSTVYWYAITFSDVGDDYFSVEEYDPFFICYVRVHQYDFGVQTSKSVENVGEFTQTFFMTASENGVVYHTKLDNDYHNAMNCEKDLSVFEQSCESEGGILYRHKADCGENNLHLTCSTSLEHLSDSVANILNVNAQKMKQWCMEGK